MDKQQRSTTFPRKLRVLIVENRPVTRSVHADNVARWGFEPVVVEGSGDTLIQNALALARSRCCHLALVDKRLRDDYNRLDTSGIDLIEKLKPTSTILITGYEDHESTEAAHQAGVVAVVTKKQGPETVRNALQKAADEYWHPTIYIVWPSGWSAMRIINLLVADRVCSSPACDNEAEHIIARLFPQARKVVLERLNRAAQTPKSARIPAVRHNSLIFLAYEDNKTPVIIKLLPYRKSIQEWKNYGEFIDGYIEGNRYANMVARQDLWNLGGHVYKLIGLTGTDILTFDDLYTQPIHDPKSQLAQDQELINILADFFGTIWQRNNGRTELYKGSLFQLYDQNWNRKLSQRLAGWRERPARIHKSQFLPVSVPNPLRWLAANLDASNLPNVAKAIVHGDLHGENLLLDKEHFAWVIDYEDTGYGHILRDYVQLTQNILTRLYPEQDDLIGFYELAVSLTRPRSPDEKMHLTQALSNQPDSLRTFRTINAIREFAHRFTGYRDSREFLWGILLDIAKLEATLSERDKRRRKLLYLGGIICYRLEHWGDRVWPPEDWPQVEWLADLPPLLDIEPSDKDNAPKIKILLLAADPERNLRLDQEMKAIDEVLREADLRDNFELKLHLATQVSDLQKAIQRYKPAIVHFSGHSTPSGELQFADTQGHSALVSSSAIIELFRALRKEFAIRCVVLNACYTEQLADGLAEHIDAVIGMFDEIGDDSARTFSVGFYQGLGYNNSIGTAFELGCNAIGLQNLGGVKLPKLIARRTDPNNLYFFK